MRYIGAAPACFACSRAEQCAGGRRTPLHTDAYQRQIDYLRLSITDRCGERCVYCLPEGFKHWRPREEILRYEEILAVVRVAVSLGFRKFRVTGGEPLAREDVDLFIGDLATQAGVQSVGLSTNGVRLAPMATRLARAGLRNVNISLDAIDAAVYERITGGQVDQVLRGIDAARAAGIDRIKLNAVLMRGVNDSQVWPLIEFASEYRLPLRFIELMPVSLPERVGGKNFLPIAEVQSAIRERTRLVPDPVRHGHGPAVYYRLPDYGILLGFIGAITDRHFCGACNKMRLTAEGRIRPCLGDHREIDLKPALRPQVDSEALRQGILDALQQKPWAHSFGNQYQPERIMTAIGG